MRVAKYTPNPDIERRWDQAGESIPEIPFFYVQTPRRKDYKDKGQYVIRGHKGNNLAIHATLIEITPVLFFSDWKRPDGKKRDIALILRGDEIYLYEFPDKSKTIEERRRRVWGHFKNHPILKGQTVNGG